MRWPIGPGPCLRRCRTTAWDSRRNRPGRRGALLRFQRVGWSCAPPAHQRARRGPLAGCPARCRRSRYPARRRLQETDWWPAHAPPRA
ncbi:hypothetical protein G6F63_016797 [Rhizopus arrhizus]|nr:hypothetical protein G6F63_016797 [Rhizopus arrhizus]